jgi:hypothetical protein
MSTLSSRPRALVLATAAGAAIAIACTVGLAAPAQAAPVLSGSAQPASSVPSPSLGTGGSFVSPRAVAPSTVRPFTALPSTTGRSAAPSITSSTTVTSSPAGSIAPAAVQGAYNPDSATPQEVDVNGTLYGLGFDPSLPADLVEVWTGQRWVRPAGLPLRPTTSIASIGGTLYFATYDVTSGAAGRSTLWKYDGTSFTQIEVVTGLLNVVGTGTSVDLYTKNGSTTRITQYDGTTLTSGPTVSLTIDGIDSFAGQGYFWAEDSQQNEGFYRIDGTTATKVADSPYAIDGEEWNGAFYFGGVDDSGNVGIFRFDGTTISRVDVGDLFANAADLPSVGAVGDRLYFTADDNENPTDLYSYNGSATTDLGQLGTKGSYAYNFTEHDGDLFMGLETGDTVQTWIYDAASTEGDPILSDTPTITGSAVAGQTLTAVPGDWTPTATFSYQWNRDGSPIAGATGATHQLGSDDFQHTVSVTVTGSQTGFTSASATSAATASVTTGTMVLAPAVTGTPTAGQTLTAATPGLVPSTATLTYQWLRSGKAIAGATGRTYRAVLADVTHGLSVTVSATGVGFTPATKTSPARTIGNAFLKAPIPAVIGTFAVGHKLAAVHGTWSPAPTYHYQWFRSGHAITGAIGSTYTLAAADRGASVTVQVIGTRPNYTTVYKMSGGHTIK